MHELFDKVDEAVESYVDMIAERIVQLGGIAEGTARVAASRSQLEEYPLTIADGLAHVEAVARALSILRSLSCLSCCWSPSPCPSGRRPSAWSSNSVAETPSICHGPSPQPRELPHTAVVMPTYNEDPVRVFAGLVLAIPVSVWSSRVTAGAWAKQHGLWLLPEEIIPPQLLQRLQEELRNAHTRRWAAPRDGLAWVLEDPSAFETHLALLPPAAVPSDPLHQHRLEGLRLKVRCHGFHTLASQEKRELPLDPDSIRSLNLEPPPALDRFQRGIEPVSPF